jgi:hypothetical protein
VTWGLESSLSIRGTDAFVANKLAKSLNLVHEFYPTDFANEPVEDIMNRFMIAGEGRIDHLAGYMDGFKIWQILYKKQVQGIIRGDEGFGWENVNSPEDLRGKLGCNLCNDFSNLKNYKDYGFPEQEIPAFMNQREGESIYQWRDRLYHEFRLPTILSALAELKLAYVEQVNPLLSRSILTKIRQLPDRLRTDKALFKKIVLAMGPDIEFATRSANASTTSILQQRQLTNWLKKELLLAKNSRVLPDRFIDFVFNGINMNEKKKSPKMNLFPVKQLIKKIIPVGLKRILRHKILLPQLDSNILAFRTVLIVKMAQLFRNASSVD